MTTTETLTMALEVLENIYDGFKTSPRVQYTAITAIKEALAQPEQWTPEDMAHRPSGLPQTDPTPEQLAALGWQSIECPFCGTSGAQAFPKPETDWEGIAADQAMTIALMKSEQEPVATVTSETGNPDVTMSWWHEPALLVGTKLYTTPPKREWVGLTHKEVNEIEQDGEFWKDHTPLDFANAIEAKLKEMNHD